MSSVIAALDPGVLRKKLDRLYARYNHRAFVDPDPLLFLYRYPGIQDREVAGLVAACLAYGRVGMIMKTVDGVLKAMGPSPYGFLINRPDLARIYRGFKYRFATETHLVALLRGIQGILQQYNSLEACFADNGPKVACVTQGLSRIHAAVRLWGDPGHLMADPAKASACKRSHLFLRWMVRTDDVDPGGWKTVSPGQLIIPLDTHMYRIGRLLGFTALASPGKACAMEITQGFRAVRPRDPIRYDFALTRFGIRQQFDIHDLQQFLLR